MTISSLALGAKKVIDAAWLHGDAYDLSSQAAFALESARLLQSPEVAAEFEALRARVAELEQQREADHKTWQHDLRTARGERETATARVGELEEQVRLLNTQRGDVAQLVERERGYGEECVDIDDLTAALYLDSDETTEAGA